MKMHSCWKRWQLVQRPSSDASKPEQRICFSSVSLALSVDPPASIIPCDVCSIGTQWRCVAGAPVGPGIPYVVEEAHEDPADIVHTSREEACGTCPDGLAGVGAAVEWPCLLALRANFRSLAGDGGPGTVN